MAALGYIMMAGMFGGAFANSVVDATHLKENCKNSQKMIDEMEKMHKFYEMISVENYKNQEECDKLLSDLKTQHDTHKLSIDDYLKNNNDRQRRMEIVLLTSLCIIYVNFILKSNIFPMMYNNFYGKN
jgi:hypothetical protein